MNLNNKYNFKEKELGPDFAQDKIKEFRKLIEASISFVVTSMPGVGTSYFLKYLSLQNFAHFIHVDLYSLSALTQHEFYKLLLFELGGKPASKTDDQLLTEAKKILQTLAQNREKIVLIFNHFDQLNKEFDNRFLSNIQSLTTVTPNKIVLIFTSIKPLNEIAGEPLEGGNLNFFSETLYFKPYSKEDLRKLLTIEPPRSAPKEVLDRQIELSGGHNQLLQILRRSQKQQNLLLDQFVKLQLKGLIDYLDYFQRKQLQKIALGKKIEEVDEYLLGVGIVKQSTPEGGVEFELFTPLLTEYIRQNLPVKLAVKESKLFKLLRKNMGSVVNKEEIFKEVWGENDENASDWALDALIYRLRKHPFLKSNNYLIESHKKIGYTLVQV